MSPRKKCSSKLKRPPNNSATEVTLATTDFPKRKKVDRRASETQTSTQKKVEKATITAEDLTSEEKPGELYWERLAEKRREALEETLTENQRLHERIEGLEAELNTSRQMLEEARNLVEVLTEMLNENEAEREIESDGAAGVGGEQAGNILDVDDNSSTTKSSIEQPLLASNELNKLENPLTP
ncbi:geminin isoform X2 [Eurosta solidaginis]|uniref:geminin isoform X2 n=1 Tax=Eurosta solidaginis TaxID=178769 RepID=UPI0035314CAC